MKNSPNEVDYMYISSVDMSTWDTWGTPLPPTYRGLPGRKITVAYKVVHEDEESLTFEVGIAEQSKKDPFIKKIGRKIAHDRFMCKRCDNKILTVTNGPGAMFRLRQAIVNSDLVSQSFAKEYERYGELGNVW